MHSGAAGTEPFRVLCLGYSITEQQGYVEQAQARAIADNRGIEILKSGWGGHSLPTLAYLIDEILDAKPCDLVLLEPFTGSVRHFTPGRMRMYLDEILAATARRGLPVAFLNLYQGGVDYETDPVAGLIGEYRTLYDIPCLDLAGTVAGAGRGALGYLMKDGTHVAPAGAEFYGLLVYAFIRKPPVRRGYIRHFQSLPRRFASFALHAQPALSCPFELARNGIPLHFAEIEEQREMEVDLGKEYDVAGLMLAFGPSSGTLRVRSHDKEKTIVAYDKYCYYARSVCWPIRLESTRRLRIAQLAGVPEIALRKGEVNRAARVGRVSHVFCRCDLGTIERAGLLLHRLKGMVRLAMPTKRRPRRPPAP